MYRFLIRKYFSYYSYSCTIISAYTLDRLFSYIILSAFDCLNFLYNRNSFAFFTHIKQKTNI